MTFQLVLTCNPQSQSYASKFIILCIPDEVHWMAFIKQYWPLPNFIDNITFESEICIITAALIICHACKMPLKYEICAANYLFLTFYTKCNSTNLIF